MDSVTQAVAKQWVDSLQGKWRLQVLSRSFRLGSGGTPVERPIRIRRFAEGIPIPCAQAALAYLLSKAPYSGIVYNGVPIDGEYVPLKTFWQRDDSAVVNGSQRTDGTYTLVQDLVDKNLWDKYSVKTAESCTEVAQTEWSWDAPYVEELPSTGWQQGVTWSISSVSRNEDGSFNYAKVKRVARTQHTPRLLSKITAQQTVEVESWDNLYGEPGQFTNGPEYGNQPVSVPSSSISGGVRTELSVSKNPDCTYKAQVTYTSDVTDDEDVKASRSCSETVDYEYHWAEASVEDIEPRQTQGVAVSVQGVRKTESGLFDYTVVIRTALTVDSGKATTVDSETEKVEVETWDNVYGSPGAFSGDHGNPVSIPSPYASVGLKIDVEHSKNQDCTYKVKAVWTTRKDLLVSSTSTHTQFEGGHTEVKDGLSDPLGIAPDAGDGVVTDFESVKQPDGSFRVTEKVKVERPVVESVRQVSVGRRGRRITVVDVNQTDPADVSSVGIGGSVKSEKTPGKRYNNTIVTWDATQPVRAGESCTEDILHHQHSEVKSGLGEMPSPDEHIEGSGENGLVVKRQTDMDEEGSISQTTTRDQEKQVNDYEESWQVGITGITKKRVHRNVASDDVEHLGTIPKFDRKKVGQTLRRVRTPGGLTDVEIVDIDREADPIKTGTGCSKTAFLHTDTGISSDPSGSLDTGHVDPAGGGKYTETEARLNPDGSSTLTVRSNEELPQRNAEVSYRRNAKGLITTVRHRNVVDEITPPDDQHAGDSVSREMTNGKLYNVTSVSLTPSIRPDHAACSRTIFEHSHDNVKMGSGKVDVSDVAKAENGVYHQKTSDMDSDGFVRTTDRVISEICVKAAEVQYKSDRFSKVSRVTDKNVLGTVNPLDFLGDDQHEVVTVSLRRNPGGSADITTETDRKKFRSWDQEVDENLLYEKIVWFVNATKAEKDELFKKEDALFDSKMKSWVGDFYTAGDSAGRVEDLKRKPNPYGFGSVLDCDVKSYGHRVPSNYSVTPNVTQNANGLYDGTFRFSARWDTDSSGKDGTLNAIYHWWDYPDRSVNVQANASSGGTASITTTVIDRQIWCGVGRGMTLLNAILTGYGTLFSGTHMDYNPVSKVWHATLVHSCKIKVNGTGV